MVEAKDVEGNEEKLEGPVSHDHFPPEVECEVPVICQEVRVRHGALVNDACKHSDRQHDHQKVLAKKFGEVSEMINRPGESETQEEGREIAELEHMNSCHMCASITNNDSLIEVNKCKKGKPDDDVADAAKDDEANQAGKEDGGDNQLGQTLA